MRASLARNIVSSTSIAPAAAAGRHVDEVLVEGRTAHARLDDELGDGDVGDVALLDELYRRVDERAATAGFGGVDHANTLHL